ncbi:MAG: aminoglycoside phosphotransferase [Gallionellales bacterium RBG_16_56_9]|nr:MAG: aminoglycoside phosphotransferase [Gallionellales bacterium RBG_16_56_9]
MQRQQQLTAWLHSQFPNETFTLAPASADASFRRYFRATFAERTLVVMDAPPQHEDCRPFLHIGKLFEDAGTHVPHVYAQDLRQGFLLLSDLGNTTYLQALCGGVAAQQRDAQRPPPCGKNAGTARELYGAATDALIKIQLASRENELPPYGEALLLREMRLFPEWYIAKHLNVALSDAQNATLEKIFARIVASNLAQPRVYVHRDYHSRNLMYVEFPSPSSPPRAGERDADSLREFLFNPGILDFQDAVYGPITYDLASLFKDAYIHWEEAEALDWLIRYWEKAREAGLPVNEDFSEFYRDYEWMGVQRHLKVLGIFARLYHRDGKDGYLKDLPLVMAYLRSACARYIDLKPLLNLLDTLEPRNNPAGYTF